MPKDEKREMFKRKYRLPKGARFGKSRLITSPFFAIKIKENGLLFNRFSTVVSKKVDKRAVARNKIRRLVNSCISDLVGELKNGYDMIIIAKKNMVDIDKNSLCIDLNRVLKSWIYKK